MASNKITGKELRAIGFPEGKVIATVMYCLEKYYKGKSKKQKLELMKRVADAPALYKKHEQLGQVAQDLMLKLEAKREIELNRSRVPYQIYGAEGIEPGAIHQMELAMKLPITVSGALMADAHQGYGLPIGGVLAVENAVIPYGVGVDIGCRMCLSVFEIGPSIFTQFSHDLKDQLMGNTRFGNESFRDPIDHEVLSRKEFDEIGLLKKLKDKAFQQIGTSGGGNHFVEFGTLEISEYDESLGLIAGKYLALLSHSGSRALGAMIAKHYTKLAKARCPLPNEAKHLAWLDLNTEKGQEYWLAMSLAGDYASACHHQIHERVAKALGEPSIVMVENHHNFAWKEQDAGGKEIIVHRKGATPAGKGILGIIPGSMTSPGFVVKGKGNVTSVNSASHGAGRVMSRRRAKETLSKNEVIRHIRKAGVEVIGSGIDEAPMVYKDIHEVMTRQTELVDVLGQFSPKIVRMCGDRRFAEVD